MLSSLVTVGISRIIRRQKYLKVNKEKTAFLAGSKFKELLFGAEHPYGYFLSEQAIENIHVTALQDFYKKRHQRKH